MWRPSLVKDFVLLEQLQRRATKYILFDYQSDYKSRLSSIKLLPLMYRMEYIESVFFFVQFKHRDHSFDICNYFSFSTCSTRSSAHNKLVHSSLVCSPARHTFFHRFPRLWNSLPPIDHSMSIPSFKHPILLTNLQMFLILLIHTHYTLYVHALIVCVYLSHPPLSPPLESFLFFLFCIF